MHELQTNLTIFTHTFVAIENGSMMISNGRYFHTREALAGDVADPQPRHKARSCSALDASPAWLPIHGERTQEPLTARSPRHRPAEIPDRDLCSWLLLAWP